MINAYAKVGDVEAAEGVVEEMMERGHPADLVAYASVARLFSRRGDWAKCEAFADQMKREGVRMNEYFLYTLLLSYGNGQPRQCSRAERAFRDAVAAGVKANDHVQGALRRVLGPARSQVLVKEVTGKEMAPTALASVRPGPRRNAAP